MFVYPKVEETPSWNAFLVFRTIGENAEVILKDLSKYGFHQVFKDWQDHWDKCIATNEGYFEKVHQNLVDK